ncbi:hypothetical protein [Pseudomonas sp. BN414]|nr:hypothetical protein [Pseudomonas sp. BN414]
MARRKRIFIAYMLALLTFTAWMGASGLAGKWTAEQPVGAYTAAR